MPYKAHSSINFVFIFYRELQLRGGGLKIAAVPFSTDR
jgi:hypothetical protein